MLIILFGADLLGNKQIIGTFKRFYNTEAVIYSLEVTDEQYLKIENTVKVFLLNSRLYKFNICGLIAILFHRRLRRKYKFYCAEFVKYLFDEAQITNNLPEIIKPEDFLMLSNIKLLYKGKLNDYNVEKVKYFEKV